MLFRSLGVYIVRGDGTTRDSSLGAVDADEANPDNVVPNCKFLGNVICHVATNTVEMARWFEFECSAQYLSPLLVNRGSVALSSTATDCKVTIWPMPYESQ